MKGISSMNKSKIKNIIGLLTPAALMSKKKDVPKILYERYHKMLLFAGGSFIAGIIALIANIQTNVLIGVLFIIMSFAFFAMGVYYKAEIEVHGFKKYIGEVTFVKESIATPKLTGRQSAFKKPHYYHVRVQNGEIYKIPAIKQTAELPMGSNIAFYSSITADISTRNGITTVNPIWCYEIIDELIFISEE